MVLTKSIKVSEKTHKLLTKICPKSKSYNDIIYNALVEQYTKEEYLPTHMKLKQVIRQNR